MSRLYLLVAIIGIAVIIYSLIECLRSGRHEVRSIPKPAWLAIIVLLPLIGAGMWMVFGRPVYADASPRRAQRRPVAPDDDPAFLRNLEVRRRQQAREAQARETREAQAREAQLKKREAERQAREERQERERLNKEGHKEGPDTGNSTKK